MPRHKGLSMRRPKKTKIEQSNEAFEEPPDPPAAPEPADPPTPERTQVKRVRPPQSPGMKAVKAAAYEAVKAYRVAAKAEKMFRKKRAEFLEHREQMFARIEGIGRDWKKKGRPAHSTHLDRVWKAEVSYRLKHISSLQSQVVFMALEIDAKDAEIAEKDARLCRLARLLRVAKGRARAGTVDEE